MQIETLQTSDLIPYARNSRTHSAEQITQVANSIKEFGFTNPFYRFTSNVCVNLDMFDEIMDGANGCSESCEVY